MIQHSESIAALGKALAAAQGEIENAAKNAKNDHFRNSYADLAEVLNTARPVLAKHGIAVTQAPGFADGRVTVTTMLMHGESGEWIRSTASAPAVKQDPQGVGSAITYLRRYSLAAVVGIAQEDDDAEGAVGRGKDRQQRSRPAAKAKPATEAQAELIRKMAASSVLTDAERARALGAIEKGPEVASKAIEWLMKTVNQRKADRDEASGAA